MRHTYQHESASLDGSFGNKYASGLPEPICCLNPVMLVYRTPNITLITVLPRKNVWTHLLPVISLLPEKLE